MNYFQSHSSYTEPAKHKDLFLSVGNNIEEICVFAQNLLIHAYWVDKYHYSISDNLKYKEMQLRSISEILNCAYSKKEISQEQQRMPNHRVVSTCRDFSLLVCSILRTKGMAARLRCGFATYLRADAFEDHWICEYWDLDNLRWIMVDAQLDDIHLKTLDIDFSKTDVPRNKFIFAGKAWELCRNEEEDSRKFGIHNVSGLSFIKSNIVRDLFALGKIETLPWDQGWGILQNSPQNEINSDHLPALDNLATISKDSNEALALEAIKSKNLMLPNEWLWSLSPTIEDLMNDIDTL